MSDHEWCQDVSRDQAVRAAEDAAAVPSIQHRDLPDAVADLRERVARLEAVIPKSASGSHAEVPENKGYTMPADGLRTERVTLEFRIEGSPPTQWPWSYILSRSDAIKMRPGESVRVVDETEAMKCMTKLRRERDAARAECERLRSRVAELESAAAAQPIEWIARHEQTPPVGKYVLCRWDVSARPGYAREVRYGVAKRGFDGMWRATNGVEKIAPVHWMPLLPGVEGGDSWEAPPASAPAADAGGEVDG